MQTIIRLLLPLTGILLLVLSTQALSVNIKSNIWMRHASYVKVGGKLQ